MIYPVDNAIKNLNRGLDFRKHGLKNHISVHSGIRSRCRTPCMYDTFVEKVMTIPKRVIKWSGGFFSCSLRRWNTIVQWSQTRTQSLFMCFWGERRLGVRIGWGARGLMGRYQGKIANPNLLSIQKHINSDWVRVCIEVKKTVIPTNCLVSEKKTKLSLLTFFFVLELF